MKIGRIQIILISVLMLGTAIATTHYFEIGMMGLTTFVLAYLSKGMRKQKSPTATRIASRTPD